MRLFGSPNIEKMINKKNIKGLIRVLDNENDDLRQSAADALTNIGYPAVDQLIETLNSNSLQSRKEAIVILGEIGDRRAVRPLIDFFNNKEIALQRYAVDALISINDDSALEPLIVLLSSKSSKIRADAALTLDGLNWKPDNVEEKVAYLIAKGNWDDITSLGLSAVDFLAKYLDNEAIETRRAVASTLKQLGWDPNQDETGAYYWIAKQEWKRVSILGESALKPLMKIISYNDIDYEDAIIALSETNDPRAIIPISRLLKKRNINIVELPNGNVDIESIGFDFDEILMLYLGLDPWYNPNELLPPNLFKKASNKALKPLASEIITKLIQIAKADDSELRENLGIFSTDRYRSKAAVALGIIFADYNNLLNSNLLEQPIIVYERLLKSDPLEHYYEVNELMLPMSYFYDLFGKIKHEEMLIAEVIATLRDLLSNKISYLGFDPSGKSFPQLGMHFTMLLSNQQLKTYKGELKKGEKSEHFSLVYYNIAIEIAFALILIGDKVSMKKIFELRNDMVGYNADTLFNLANTLGLKVAEK